MAVVAPSMILGERPDREAAPPAGSFSGDPARSAWLAGPSVLPAALTVVAAALERAPERTIVLTDLPPALRCRTALQVLARRADRRGKRLALSHCSREMRAIAISVGWTVTGGGPFDDRRATQTATLAAGSPAAARVGASAAGGASLDRGATTGQGAAKGWRAKLAGRAGTVNLSRPKSAARATFSVRPAAQATAGLPARRLPRRSPATLPLGGAAATAMLALAVLIGPSATVTLTPAAEQVTFELPVVVDPGIKKPDVAQGRLPGRAIDKEVADTAQASTTGRKVLPDARAGGEVVFVNKTDKTVAVPKGTVVLAGSVRFATQADLNLRGTVFSGPQQRISMQRVAVQAANGGANGNVAPFQINKVEGPLASQLDAQNDAPTRGGSDKTVAFVTAEDRRKLEEALTRTLVDRLNQQIKSQLPAPDKETAVPWSGQNPVVTDATFSKSEGDEAQILSLTIKVRYGATVFGNAGYNAFVQELAADRARQLKPGYDVDRGSVAAQPPEVQGIEDGAVRLLAHAKAATSAHLDTGRVRTSLVNQPLGQVRAYLGTVPGVAQADVRAWPGWLGRTPLLGWRVAIRTRP